MSFVHLHCHSYYSMMHATAPLDDLVRTAAVQGMPALALTDLNGIYAWVEFVQTCQEYGVKPICGVELRAADAQAVLLAYSPRGYRRICRLVSDFHLAAAPPLAKLLPGPDDAPVEIALPRRKTPPPEFSLAVGLLEDREGLAVLTRDLDLLRHLARETGTAGLYAELIPGEENLSRIQAARELGITAVASNAVCLLKPEDFRVYRLARAIDENTTIDRASNFLTATPERFFCDEAWMREKLSYCPEAIDAAARLAESLHHDWPLGETVFPPFAEFSRSEAYFTLRWKCYEGARRRYPVLTEKINARLEYELEMIRKKGFTHYFLVVEDIVCRWPRTCGRGSVAASLVSYCLGITHVDPIRYNLMFERFLNPGRKDPPDADIDFPWDERDGVLDYIFEKYGEHRAAMVSNHVRVQGRAAIREIAKVCGISDEEIRRMRKRVVHMRPETLPSPWNKIVAGAEAIHDFPRHLSVHCGGVLIVPDDLRNYVPLERAAKGVNVVQWEKNQSEDFGLVKIDVLGNRSLAVIRDAWGEVARHTGEAVDYQSLDPTQDAETQAIVRRGETMGVFYVESPATRQLQEKAGVGDYEHMVIHSSIIRPASQRYINEYVERLHGKQYRPVHPLLADILEETHGVMVYQEHVTQTAMALAGFDSVDGDGLRKALSKKRPGRKLAAYREQFFAGAAARGVAPTVIQRCWDMIMSFAGYSFCKPHSASYALVSYQSAYLRAHYPAEFIAAVISNGGGYYSTFAYLSEARRLGLEILPPNINLSEIHYSGCDRQVRIGFQQIHRVAEATWKRIVVAREAGGAFRSLEDFLGRVPVDSAETRILIRAGCFDALEPGLNRPQLIAKLLQVRDGAARAGKLFGEGMRRERLWIPKVPDYSEAEKLRDEREIFGFLISRHPLQLCAERLAARAHVDGREIRRHVGRSVVMAGYWIADKVVLTKHEEPMAFMSFEDTTALYETVFFPRAYRDSVLSLNDERPFWLHGQLMDDHGAVTLNVARVEAISY